MKRFKDSLWDDTDPLYAPCISKSRNSYFWKVPKKYSDMGYSVPLEERKLIGAVGDGRDEERAKMCRHLTRQMLDHFSADTPKVRVGTWEWIFKAYQSDRESPYHGIKPNTRDLYDLLISKWISAIGASKISEANFKAVKRWENAMIENGRSRDWISRMFTMMRTVVRYGCAIEDKECQRFSAVLSSITFKKGKSKDTSGTPEQIASIVAAAQKGGAHAFALGCAIQWWFSLRAVDVRGQWLAIQGDDDGQGIVRDGMRWHDGLTWDMFDRDVTKFTKTMSKTKDTTGETRTFNLTQVPEVRDLLLQIPIEKRVGPVIVSERHGLPYTKYGWSQAWRRFRKDAKVPDHVKNMGIRSTALTHGKNAGASPFDLRDAAGHSDVSTTNIYIRGKDEAAAKVVSMRRNGSK